MSTHPLAGPLKRVLKRAFIDEKNASLSYFREKLTVNKYGRSEMKNEIIKEYEQHFRDERDHLQLILKILIKLGVPIINTKTLTQELTGIEPVCSGDFNPDDPIDKEPRGLEKRSLQKLMDEERCAYEFYARIVLQIDNFLYVGIKNDDDREMFTWIRKNISAIELKEREHEKDLRKYISDFI